MYRHIPFTLLFSLTLAAVLLVDRSAPSANAATRAKSSPDAPPAREVELFEAIRNGDIQEKFIAMSDRAGRLIITNKTDQPLEIKLPEAFAAVPALAQFGGGGGGRVGGGGTGGGVQTGGGGFGGGGAGGGGGGFFSVPPESTRRIDVPLLCLDHGLRNPTSSMPFRIMPASYIERPAVVELLKAFGNGQLQHGAAQAAAWHLNSDMSWEALAAKLQGTRRNIHRPPYFSADEIRAGMAYAQEAVRRAEEAETNKEFAEPATDDHRSEQRSTQDTAD